MDFAQNYKTLSGIIITILAMLLGKYATANEIATAVANIGQIIGAVLAVYGFVMKIRREYKTPANPVN